MPITAGEISDTISLLRSKIRVYETWKTLIQANYMPYEGAGAEARIDRPDGAVVTEKHFAAVIEEVVERIEELQSELAEWEGLVFDSTSEPPEDDTEDEEPAAAKAPKKLTKEAAKPAPRKKNGPQLIRVNRDSTASK